MESQRGLNRVGREILDLADALADGRSYEYVSLVVHFGDGVPDLVFPVTPPDPPAANACEPPPLVAHPRRGSA